MGGVGEMMRYDCGVFLKRAKNAISSAAIYCFVGGVIMCEKFVQIQNKSRAVEGRLIKTLENKIQ